ncbi:MAG: hypothetical protein LBF22_01450 [Deltaproteobacteria bacterium]|nr:hypothetical protein [Deltaproteobacteria bacterium]
METKKFNKNTLRLFSFLSTNWKGQPSIHHETEVNLISNNKASADLKVLCTLKRKKFLEKNKTN